MGNWNDLLDEIQEIGGPYDVLRRRYIKALSEITGRNTIAYYSGWLQKPGATGADINDADKTGLMTTIHELDVTKGLDLVLHTPGGDGPATESIVSYLRSIFKSDIRAIVPELAMSAGTMIACSCKSILMGKHSSLGPIDPQIYGVAAHGIIEEFKKAQEEVKLDPSRVHLWREIIARYNPTLLGECQKVIDWSVGIVVSWLESGMLAGTSDPKAEATKIVDELGSHDKTKLHSRHYSAAQCEKLGLVIEKLESDKKLQDAVLSMHHAYIHTLGGTGAIKIIENQKGKAYVLRVGKPI